MVIETMKGIMLFMVHEGWRAAVMEIRQDVLGPIGFAAIGNKAEKEEGEIDFL